MLLELHVKNLALIEKADVEFGEGLNILTGETGAGKSIIIGSVTMALGGKASKDVIRRGADHAYIELIFFVDSKEKKKAFNAAWDRANRRRNGDHFQKDHAFQKCQPY